MNAIEKVVIGVVSALISSSLIFVETAAYKPEVQNAPGFELAGANSQTQVATVKSPTRG